ncbi:MAG TPA: hypothetical protein VGP76_30085 [Planctomycetaceae bacterium]|jgi:hypothetical protein|nr:hypothetical protein [Planctomycetaceae bacterium]
MKRRTFYWTCLKRAFSGGYGVAEKAAFGVAIIGGIVAWESPKLNPTVAIMVWLIPLCVFLGTLIVSWTLAPYGMYRELESGLSPEVGTHSSAGGELSSLLGVEDYVDLALDKALDLVLATARKGDLEGVTRLSKENVDAVFPALIESTFGKHDKAKYETVIKNERGKSGDAWPLLFTVSIHYLTES